MVQRVPCENCGNLVAATSKLCPVCRSSSPNRWRNRFALVGTLAGGLFLLAVMSNGSQKSKPSITSASEPVGRIQSDELASSSTGVEPTAEYGDQPPAIYASNTDGNNADRAVDRVAAARRQTEAIGEALNGGSDVQWSEGGVSGTVEVKSVAATGDSRCMGYRTIEGDEKSGWLTVCETAPQTWTPSN